jgi:hypothetical protein
MWWRFEPGKTGLSHVRSLRGRLESSIDFVLDHGQFARQPIAVKVLLERDFVADRGEDMRYSIFPDGGKGVVPGSSSGRSIGAVTSVNAVHDGWAVHDLPL